MCGEWVTSIGTVQSGCKLQRVGAGVSLPPARSFYGERKITLALNSFTVERFVTVAASMTRNKQLFVILFLGGDH